MFFKLEPKPGTDLVNMAIQQVVHPSIKPNGPYEEHKAYIDTLNEEDKACFADLKLYTRNLLSHGLNFLEKSSQNEVEAELNIHPYFKFLKKIPMELKMDCFRKMKPHMEQQIKTNEQQRLEEEKRREEEDKRPSLFAGMTTRNYYMDK